MTTAPLLTEIADAPAGGEAIWLDAGSGTGAVRVRAAFWMAGTRGTVLLFPGRTEYIEKYGRVIAHLVERGFSVATIDWRGQGLSDRLVDDPMKGHVGSFTDYQQDVEALLAAPQMQAAPGPHILLAHSMGGCIGLRALVDGRIKPAMTILSGPMFDIEMTTPLRLAATIMARAARIFGKTDMLAPRPGADAAYVQYEDFAVNMLTHDEEHYDWMRTHLEREPGFALGGPTLGWMDAAMGEMKTLANAPPPAVPTLLFLGEDEQIVGPEAIRRFAARAPAVTLDVIPSCKHECLMETQTVRDHVWAEIDRFLTANDTVAHAGAD